MNDNKYTQLVQAGRALARFRSLDPKSEDSTVHDIECDLLQLQFSLEKELENEFDTKDRYEVYKHLRKFFSADAISAWVDVILSERDFVYFYEEPASEWVHDCCYYIEKYYILKV